MGNQIEWGLAEGQDSGEDEITTLSAIASLVYLLVICYVTYVVVLTLSESPLGWVLLLAIAACGAVIGYFLLRKYNLLPIWMQEDELND
jgi:hypothetical protein